MFNCVWQEYNSTIKSVNMHDSLCAALLSLALILPLPPVLKQYTDLPKIVFLESLDVKIPQNGTFCKLTFNTVV